MFLDFIFLLIEIDEVDIFWNLDNDIKIKNVFCKRFIIIILNSSEIDMRCYTEAGTGT